MANVNAEPDFDRLLATINRLPKSQKVQIWQTLDAELNREEIRREFAQALEETWSANEHFGEEEVDADIKQALREVRTEKATRRP